MSLSNKRSFSSIFSPQKKHEKDKKDQNGNIDIFQQREKKQENRTDFINHIGIITFKTLVVGTKVKIYLNENIESDWYSGTIDKIHENNYTITFDDYDIATLLSPNYINLNAIDYYKENHKRGWMLKEMTLGFEAQSYICHTFAANTDDNISLHILINNEWTRVYIQNLINVSNAVSRDESNKESNVLILKVDIVQINTPTLSTIYNIELKEDEYNKTWTLDASKGRNSQDIIVNNIESDRSTTIQMKFITENNEPNWISGIVTGFATKEFVVGFEGDGRVISVNIKFEGENSVESYDLYENKCDSEWRVTGSTNVGFIIQELLKPNIKIIIENIEYEIVSIKNKFGSQIFDKYLHRILYVTVKDHLGVNRFFLLKEKEFNKTWKLVDEPVFMRLKSYINIDILFEINERQKWYTGKLVHVKSYELQDNNDVITNITAEFSDDQFIYSLSLLNSKYGILWKLHQNDSSVDKYEYKPKAIHSNVFPILQNILDIADTVHDMVHPVAGSISSHRCKIETYHDKDKIYNRDTVIYSLLSNNEYNKLVNQNYKNLSPEVRTKLLDLFSLVTMKDTTDINSFLKTIIDKESNVKDYEDAVVKQIDDNFIGPCENIVDAYSLLEHFKQTSTTYMVDCLPPGAPSFSRHAKLNLSAITTYWDPSLKYGKSTLKQIGLGETLETIGSTSVKFSDEYVHLSKTCMIPEYVITSRANFRNSVGALCNFVQSLQRKMQKKLDEIDKQNIVYNSLFYKPILDVDRDYLIYLEEQIKSHDYFKDYVKYLFEDNQFNGILNRIFDIKRSGDYGQISMVKLLNDKKQSRETFTYLLTFDRLCYLRCKLEKVPAVLLKPRNPLCKVFKPDGLYEITNLKQSLINCINIKIKEIKTFTEIFKINIQFENIYHFNIPQDIAVLFGNFWDNINEFIKKEYIVSINKSSFIQQDPQFHKMKTNTLIKYNEQLDHLIELYQNRNIIIKVHAVLDPELIFISKMQFHIYKFYFESDLVCMGKLCDSLNSMFDFLSTEKELSNPFVYNSSIINKKSLFKEVLKTKYLLVSDTETPAKSRKINKIQGSRTSGRYYSNSNAITEFKRNAENVFKSIEFEFESVFLNNKITPTYTSIAQDPVNLNVIHITNVVDDTSMLKTGGTNELDSTILQIPTELINDNDRINIILQMRYRFDLADAYANFHYNPKNDSNKFETIRNIIFTIGSKIDHEKLKEVLKTISTIDSNQLKSETLKKALETITVVFGSNFKQFEQQIINDDTKYLYYWYNVLKDYPRPYKTEEGAIIDENTIANMYLSNVVKYIPEKQDTKTSEVHTMLSKYGMHHIDTHQRQIWSDNINAHNSSVFQSTVAVAAGGFFISGNDNLISEFRQGRYLHRKNIGKHRFSIFHIYKPSQQFIMWLRIHKSTLLKKRLLPFSIYDF